MHSPDSLFYRFLIFHPVLALGRVNFRLRPHSSLPAQYRMPIYIFRPNTGPQTRELSK